MGYLATLVLLGLLILIHEAGHLAAAKGVGIPVAGFSVGFGPKLWSRQWRGTEYSLRALPLGGFVLPAVADPDEFRAFPLGRRVLYFLGGPLANLVAALPVLAVLDGSRYGASLYTVLVLPFVQITEGCGQILASLAGMLTHPGAIAGVVGIMVTGNSQAATQGTFVEFALSLSISLAVLNLLPIPVLDGGQILMGCLEELFPRLVRLRAPLTVLGMVVLAAVMIYANGHDVVSLLRHA
ncbi:MAG TPA: site-2 protease family protein [Thermoanaerobaculia bacterium]|nr:site-2 protease family protein [Thermoanaerobaculia bacterium]